MDDQQALMATLEGNATMSNHTPGPWTYESDHTHRQYNIRMLGHLIGVKDEAKHICTLNNLPKHVLANRDPVTAEANARLISAAPDLLASLVTTSDALAQFARDHINHPYAKHCLDIVENARAVIDKATGAP